MSEPARCILCGRESAAEYVTRRCAHCVHEAADWRRIEAQQQVAAGDLPPGLRGFCCPEHGPVYFLISGGAGCGNCEAAAYLFSVSRDL